MIIRDLPIETLAELRRLQAEIAMHGNKGVASFHARWQFGRETGKISLSLIAEKLGVSITEISYRRTFFKRVPEQKIESFAKTCDSWNRAAKRFSVAEKAVDKRKPYSLETHIKLKERTINAVLAMAGQPKTREEIARNYGCKDTSLKYFIGRVGMLPWVRITPDDAGRLTFTIDYDLKEFCDNNERGVVAEYSLAEHFAHLQEEIIRIRAENKIERSRRVWTGERMLAFELAKLVNFIEGELDKVPKLKRTLKSKNEKEKEETTDDNKEERQDDPAIDRGSGEEICRDGASAG